MKLRNELLIGAVIIGLPIIGSVMLSLLMENDYPLE